MTLALHRNNEYVGEAGTNSGWADLAEHLRSLDVRLYPNACHLAEYGWARFAAETATELARILRDRPPQKEPARKLLADIVQDLQAITLVKTDQLTVSDGTT